MNPQKYLETGRHLSFQGTPALAHKCPDASGDLHFVLEHRLPLPGGKSPLGTPNHLSHHSPGNVQILVVICILLEQHPGGKSPLGTPDQLSHHMPRNVQILVVICIVLEQHPGGKSPLGTPNKLSHHRPKNVQMLAVIFIFCRNNVYHLPGQITTRNPNQ